MIDYCKFKSLKIFVQI